MRKRFMGLMLLLLLAAGCSAEAGHRSDTSLLPQIYDRYPALKEKKYEVDSIARIVDGDTFETKSGEKVRLIGVNTPEITNGKNENYGLEAKNYSQAKLKGQTVYLFRDTGSTDKYGRLLRYLFLETSPVMFNETLVAEGYANTMTVPPNVMYADHFVSVERKARSQNKGLWGTPKGTASGVGAGCGAPAIKGNINAKKEKIYHVPGGRYYDQTEAEEMFCTEDDATAAGYRKSSQ